MSVALFQRLAGCVVVTLAAFGCAVGADGGVPHELPDRASFPLVSGALERRCATLDCHGDRARSLRFFTGSGLRLDPADVPGSGSTTEAEYDASYQSVVGLEPELMSAVVAERGSGPERLTLVRKARGLEDHKGGAVLKAGEPADRCVLSWLASATDETSCVSGAELGPPIEWPDTGGP
jgi:hypothetical protein